MNTRRLCALSFCILMTFATMGHGAQQPTSVTVNNTSANPVPVDVQNQLSTKAADNPAFQAYDEFRTTTVLPGNIQADFSYDLPVGKRLVIEFVTVSVIVPAGQNGFTVTVFTGGISKQHYIPVISQGTDTNGLARFVAAQQTKLFAEAGGSEAFHISIARNSSSGQFLAGVSVSGHLVDIP
jgi:hypothetical protein